MLSVERRISWVGEKIGIFDLTRFKSWNAYSRRLTADTVEAAYEGRCFDTSIYSGQCKPISSWCTINAKELWSVLFSL